MNEEFLKNFDIFLIILYLTEIKIKQTSWCADTTSWNFRLAFHRSLSRVPWVANYPQESDIEIESFLLRRRLDDDALGWLQGEMRVHCGVENSDVFGARTARNSSWLGTSRRCNTKPVSIDPSGRLPYWSRAWSPHRLVFILLFKGVTESGGTSVHQQKRHQYYIPPYS